jgi:glycopeptide antibiotics resistance protein
MPGRSYDVAAPAAAYALVATAAVAYAVWGSLFPFIFQAVDPAAARAAFWAASAGGPLAWSISDFVSNVLLFIPIGLFGAAALDAARPTGQRLAVWAGVFCFGILLSVSVEIGQAFVPWRTPSIVDVVAEALGTAVGIVGRVVAARPFDRRVAGLSMMVRRASPFERALLVYCAGFAIAWLLPLDVTLRPGEIADKHFHKRLLWFFTPSPDAASSRELAFAFLAAVPLGLAARVLGPRGERRSVARALAIAIPAACALEVMQIFVFSRTTDATILLPVSGGILIGALLASR